MPVKLKSEAETNALREKHTQKPSIIRHYDGENGWEPALGVIGHNNLKYMLYQRGMYRVYEPLND